MYAIGRNKLIRSIVKELTYLPENSRLLHITGEEGIGKKFVCKYAARYAFDRKVFSSGVLHIELRNKFALKQEICGRIASALELFFADQESIASHIKHSKLLIILNKDVSIEWDV